MTKERITELDMLAAGAIAECRTYGQSNNHALEFWKGVRMVVDELKLDFEKQQENYR